MLEKLMTNPYAWLFVSALTVFSVIFAVWTWCAGKPRKEISIHRKSDEIIKAGKQKIQKLEIMFDSRPIEDLTSTKFYIWNSGNQVLCDSDVVPSRPLRIYSTSSTILDAQILRVSDETNLFAIKSTSDDQITLSFDYVEKGDGVLVQVLHTGNPSDVSLECKIKGGRDVRDCTTTNKERYISRRDRFLEFVADMVPGLGGFFGIFSPAFLVPMIAPYAPNTHITPVTGFASVIIFVVIYVVIVVASVKLSAHLGSALRKSFNLSIPASLLSTSSPKE